MTKQAHNQILSCIPYYCLVCGFNYIMSHKLLIKATIKAHLDESLQAVLNILTTQASVKKAEVIEAVRKADIDMSEAQCMRAIKEICKSQGTSWQLAA